MNSSDVKLLPFASYDLIVHLGVGIFAAPIFMFFISGEFPQQIPAGVPNPQKASFVSSFFITLVVLFAGYVLGHVIALTSGLIIERFVHVWLGYPSDMWLYACFRNRANRSAIARQKVCRVMTSKHVFKRRRRKKCADWATRTGAQRAALTLVHAPLLLIYSILIISGFGFYMSKIPRGFLSMVRLKFRREGLPVEVRLGTLWPKVLKQYVVSNCPTAYARMSNHRVVFGLLRSLSLLGLMCTWFFLIQCCKVPSLQNTLTFTAAAVTTTMLIAGFAKFNRRFFEESVYGFILSRPPSETKTR